MVAIVSGNSAGLNISSLMTLGQRGQIGAPVQGRNAESAYVNIATGNLALQDRDDRLVGPGIDINVVRTYNNQGQLRDDNTDAWRIGLYKSAQLIGQANTNNSSIIRTDGDGSQTIYRFDDAQAMYISTSGAGAYDRMQVDSANQQLVWTDGETGVVERYSNSAPGQLISTADPVGNMLSYRYKSNGLLEKVVNTRTGVQGEAVYLDYNAARQLTQVRTVVFDPTSPTSYATLTRVYYTYDNDRLSSITVDLSPADNATNDLDVYTTHYIYDSNNNLRTITQKDKTQLSFTYVQINSTWRVRTVTDALGQTTTFTYDFANRRTQMRDPLGLTTVFEYDNQWQLSNITTPPVNGVTQTQQFAYNSNGDVIRVTDGQSHSITMEYG